MSCSTDAYKYYQAYLSAKEEKIMKERKKCEETDWCRVFQERLEEAIKTGVKKFTVSDITYISDEQFDKLIEQSFELFKEVDLSYKINGRHCYDRNVLRCSHDKPYYKIAYYLEDLRCCTDSDCSTCCNDTVKSANS